MSTKQTRKQTIGFVIDIDYDDHDVTGEYGYQMYLHDNVTARRGEQALVENKNHDSDEMRDEVDDAIREMVARHLDKVLPDLLDEFHDITENITMKTTKEKVELARDYIDSIIAGIAPYQEDKDDELYKADEYQLGEILKILKEMDDQAHSGFGALIEDIKGGVK